MLNVLNILQLVLYIALLALLGQGLLYVLAGAKRDGNFFYQLLQILSKPFTWVVRQITPNKVADHQVPMVTFFLLAIAYAVVTFEKIDLCVEAGMEGCKDEPRVPVAQARPWSCWCSVATSRRWACSTRWCRAWASEVYPRASRAHLHAQAGRHQAALADMKAAGHAARGCPHLVQPGLRARMLGRWDEALAAFVRATELARSSTVPGTAWAWC